MTKPTTTYMICTTARSGSNLLCDYLSNAGLFGSPWEFFNPDTIRHGHLGRKFFYDKTLSVKAYIDWLMENYTSSNGVFGVKVLYNDFEAFRGFPAFQQLFRGSRKIHLSRRSKTRQAISYHFATQTGQWVASDLAKLDSSLVSFNFDLISNYRQHLVWQDSEWSSLIDAGDPGVLPLVHEEFLSDLQGNLKRIADLVGVDAPLQIKTELKEQKTSKSDAFFQQFQDIFQRRSFDVTTEASLNEIGLVS